MEKVQLDVQVRMQIGGNVAKKMLREGNIPAVVYGGNGEESLPIVVELRQIQKALSTSTGINSIFDLNFGKDSVQDRITAMVRELQFDPVSRELIHADFKQISLDEPIEAEVPIVLVGEAKGVLEGGIVQQQLWSIKVECLPQELPERFELDVTELEIGENLKVEQLEVGSSLKVLDEPDEVIIAVLAPTPEEEEEEELVADEGEAIAPTEEEEEAQTSEPTEADE